MKKIFYTIMFCIGLLSVTGTNGQSKTALIFDGTNDYVDCGLRNDMNFDGTQSFTIEAWIKKNGGDSIRVILSKYNGGVEGNFVFGITAGNKIFLTRNAASPETVTSVTEIPNHLTDPPFKYLYTHVAATYDGTNVRLYINGALDIATPVGAAFSAPGTNVLIGAMKVFGAVTPNNFMFGQIEELRVWNLARTQSEIYDNRFREINTSSTGLVAYYKCNDGTGTTLTDSKTGPNGTLVNGTDWLASSVNITLTNPGNALHFDPAHTYPNPPAGPDYGDYVTCYNHYKFTTSSFTIQGSVYPTGPNPANPLGTIFSRENEYWVSRWNDGTLQVALANTNPGFAWINTGLILPLNTWTDFTIIYDRTQDKFLAYTNGCDQSYERINTTGDVGGNGPAFFMGSYYNGTDYFFNGAIDEVRIWDHIRTPAQIKSNQFTTVDPGSSGLLGYYRFDEGIAAGNNYGIAAVSDLTANKNDGALGRINGSTKFILNGSTSNFIKGMQYNSWTGTTSTDWTTSTNWGLDAVPTSGDNVTIQAGLTNQPTVASAQTIKSLTVGTTATVSLNADLNVTEGVTNNGTISGTNTLVMSGSADQGIYGNGTFTNLTIDNTNAVTLNGNTNVKGALIVNAASTLNTGGLLTLKSDVSRTARVGNSAGTINGNATIERYINSAVVSRKWHLLSGKTTNSSQNILQSWQEGGGAPATANLGTWVTSNTYTGSNGFDETSASSSILKHNAAVPSWVAATATNTGSISDEEGYMLFVRGDRYANGNNALQASTVLRTNGTLRQGTQSGVTILNSNPGFQLVGNPFASPIDVENILAATNMGQFFYIWDASEAGNYGLGKFRLVQKTGAGTYTATPTTGSDNSMRYIHSGQAFFLKTNGVGNAIFQANESDKSGSLSVVNPIVATAGNQQIYTELAVMNAGIQEPAADAVRVWYHPSFSAGTGDDIPKMGNFGENISSYRENKKLVVENRPMIANSDTIFLRTSNLKIKDYRLNINTQDFIQVNTIAFLQDNYLKTNKELDLTGAITNVDFKVTSDPASSNQDRFRIVFALAGPSTVSFTDVKAVQQGANINVTWAVSNQVNIHKYEVEKSTDGINFTKVETQSAIGTNGSNANYNWTDANAEFGNNYFRIRSIGKSGDVKISQVVLVNIGKGYPVITVYPNPVINKKVAVQFSDMEKGVYHLRLLNNQGQVVFTKTIAHAGGNASQTLILSNRISKGNYQLEINRPDNRKTTLAL